MDTDFSDITTGTMENPDKGHFDYSFGDGYWTVTSAAFAKGMLGLYANNGVYFNSLLSSSGLDFTQGNGTVFIDIKWKGNADATDASVYLTNASTDGSYHSEQITTTLKESHIELTGATKYSQLVISTYSGIVYIDEIRVYTKLSTGQKIAIPFAYKEVDATSCDFEDIAVPADYKIFYNVYSVFRPKDRLMGTASATSENIYVDLQGAVSDIESADEANAYFADGAVRVVNPNGEKVNVYGISGALVATSTGEEPIALPDGMYIVRIGSKSVKVVVRN